MRLQFRYLVAVGAVAAMMGAPVAAADDNAQTCSDNGGATECTSPGNVQINDSPPAADEPFSLPYWDEAFGGGGAYAGPYPVPYGEGGGI